MTTKKLLDSVWMVLTPENNGVIYCVGNSASEVWRRVEEEEQMGTGVTAAMLRRRGYKAKRVLIYLATTSK